MKSLIVLILLMSFPLLAEEPTPQSQTEDYESTSPVSETQTSTPTKEATGSDLQKPIAAYILDEIQRGRWMENRPPGPVFNTCSTWDGAVKCYWAFFRIANLTGQYQEVAYAIHNHLTAKGLEQELNYFKSSPDSLDPISKAWFLLMTVEFILWAAKEKLPETLIANKIIPMAQTFTDELFSSIRIHLENPRQKGLDRAGSVFVLYALYSYVSLINALTGGGFDQLLQTLRDMTQGFFLHRNDGSQVDQSIKTQVCSLMKRTGIHRNYLKEKGLLFPGYEEFEDQTAQEDRKRIKDCEKDYETITVSGEGPGEPKDMISSFHYANILMLLKISGGDEAVRYFIRHNPVFYREFEFPENEFDDTNSLYNSVLILNRYIALSILQELYDDPEWRMDWVSIQNKTGRVLLSKNVINFESKDFLVFESIIFFLFASTEPVFFNRWFVNEFQTSKSNGEHKEGESWLPLDPDEGL